MLIFVTIKIQYRRKHNINIVFGATRSQALGIFDRAMLLLCMPVLIMMHSPVAMKASMWQK